MDVKMCDFPYHTFGTSFTGKLGLYSENISMIKFECLATDVSIRRYTGCGASSEDTLDSNDARAMFQCPTEPRKSEKKGK
jgi:hypothetical protein